jgi:transposase-like protein
MEIDGPINLTTLAKHFSDEEAAYLLMERIRWGNPVEPSCPHCGVIGEATYLQPKGDGRTTNRGKVSKRRVWKCRACKRQFSVLVGTIFEGSHVPLAKWLLAIHLMCSNKNGVSAHELHRGLPVSYKTAWFMEHRIRYAMTQSPLREKLSGEVEADETYFGWRTKHGYGGRGKTPIVTLIERETGEARSQIVPRVTGAKLHRILLEEVERDAVLMTDQLPGYRKAGPDFAEHHAVNHGKDEYARTTRNGRRAHVNSAEGFFSQLKRGIDGTHHHVSEEHLHRYVAEYDFRYSTRKMSDTARTMKAIQQSAGKRLTYREPTAN